MEELIVATSLLPWMMILESDGYRNIGNVTVLDRYETQEACEVAMELNGSKLMYGRFEFHCVNSRPQKVTVMASEVNSGDYINIDGKKGVVLNAFEDPHRKGLIRVDSRNSNNRAQNYRFYLELEQIVEVWR